MLCDRVLLSRKLERATYDSMAADQADVPDGMFDPRGTGTARGPPGSDCARQTTIEARAKERHGRERADYDAKLKAR